MSIAHLFTSRVRVYRNTPATGSYREKKSSFTALDDPTVPNACFTRPGGAPLKSDAGHRAVDRITGYMEVDADVQKFDVLQVLEGPEALGDEDLPTRFRVLNIAKPRDHHLELHVEPFTGALTLAEEE